MIMIVDKGKIIKPNFGKYMGISNKFQLILQYIVPQHFLSRIMGKLAESKIRWWKNFMILSFVKYFKVDMNEALQTDPRAYACFNDFFTRAINPEFRPIAAENNNIISPADGFICEIGIIKKNKILQAKNHDYDLTAFLGGENDLAEKFYNGSFVTIYLAPKNYHRVHMPCAGTLKSMIFVPGNLFSVSQLTVQNVPNLFAQNERVINLFETQFGPMVVTLVGAMIVGSMETVWAGTVKSKQRNQIQKWEYPNDSIQLAAGDEMGRFKMGSTVIVLFPENKVTWNLFPPLQEIQMGQMLGVT